MNKLLAGIALGALLTAPALAADLRMPVKAPPPVAVAAAYSWTGCYIGGNVGAIRSDSDVTLRGSGALADVNNPLRTDSFGSDETAFTGGGQIGCNWQANAFVFGVEADIQWSGLDELFTRTRALAAPLAGNITHSVSHGIDWWGTVRGRVGVTFGAATLVYVTGGLAYANLESAATTTFSLAGDVYSASRSETRWGWTVGGGFEWGFTPNWSIKAEYLFVDLGSESFLMANVPPPAFPLNSYTADVDTKMHVARIGLNYRFGGGPVMARY